jgi:hypothetical protein
VIDSWAFRAYSAEQGSNLDEYATEGLKPASTYATVPRMHAPRLSRDARRARQRRDRRVHRLRRVAGLTVFGAIFAATLLLTAFAGNDTVTVSVTEPAPATRLVPSGPPSPQVVAVQGTLRLQLPVSQQALTALGYHEGSAGALALRPLGERVNHGFLSRIARRLFGGGANELRWYQLSGSATQVLNVGAAPGTDVYSPVDGTVVGISDHVLNGRKYGVRVDVQPSSAPSLVVSLSNLRPDPALTVGSSIAAGTSKIGTILDLSRVERQSLARYTQDSGNHVAVEVHAAATLAIR